MGLSQLNLFHLCLDLRLQVLEILLVLINVLKVTSVLREQPLDLRVPLEQLGIGGFDLLQGLVLLLPQLCHLSFQFFLGFLELFCLPLFVLVKHRYFLLQPFVDRVQLHKTSIELIQLLYLLLLI